MHLEKLPPQGSPRFGLHAAGAVVLAGDRPVVFIHGTTRADKLWPDANWIALGRILIAAGHCIALPHAGDVERVRAEAIAGALGSAAVVWPALELDALVDRMAAAQGVIGVDSGLSHIAVALDLPHVQIYNLPTSWRTGPQPAHGHAHQVSIEGQPTPSVEAVEAAWQDVLRSACFRGPHRQGAGRAAERVLSTAGTAGEQGEVRPGKAQGPP